MFQRPITTRRKEILQRLQSCSKFCALLPVTHVVNKDCATTVLAKSVAGRDVGAKAEGTRVPWSCFVVATTTFAVTTV